ncbi:MAG: hypothetical protein LBG94_01255 [Treponema sp.]|jgi:hypothetical protein|nr:hypothetical protein [Treponema sp.]
MSSGKGGNNRKNRQRFSGRRDESGKHSKKHSENVVFEEKFEKNRVSPQERPQWTAPVLPANPISTPDCPWCGNPIKDIATAICDKETGSPVHFDCVLSRIAGTESLGPNESICYIGGGRFGVVHYNNPPDTKDFSIKKIFEWESKDVNNEWRRPISEYFSIT